MKQLTGLLLAGLLLWGCSSGNSQKVAHISAQFSVADSALNSNDYSGIGLTIIKKDSANADADTLFSAVTDSSGQLSGSVTFSEKRQYPAFISRNERTIGRTGIILADRDSIEIEATLPNLEDSYTISSREHNAMKVFERVDRNFGRVAKFARAGRIKGDTLRQEILKWSDIYWDVYQDHPGTIAAEFAARNSIQILEGVDNKKMMRRIRSIQSEDRFSDIGATLGRNYIASSKGLEPALAYLDTLSGLTEDPEKRMRIKMQRINLLYDSARVDAAKQELSEFREEYADSLQPAQWVESMDYDLNYLSPGDAIPEFRFQQNGDITSRDSLKGTPYILEITNLTNRLYQNQYDRTVAIHSIYKNFGLQVVTIPLDDSQVTINAFFDERVKPWPVADAKSFDRQELIKKFNIRLVPTRFLVDRQGNIIRKYVGTEYQDIIDGIQKIIKSDKEPAS